jgi:hypothetical protein
MERNRIRSHVRLLALVASAAGVVAACGSRQPSAAAPASVQPGPPAAAPAATAAAVPAVHPLAVTRQTWTAEAMEALLAPIALYPDPVLSQVLMAATNPQEVLDAGNWLIDHPQLADKELDLAATAAGFTPPMRALMQFRQIVDQMCLKMGWTTELGQAFTNDQAGVLAAVQRLRRQAQDAGHLENSPQMAVATQEQGDQKVIVISPPNPQVVYVPQYDPTTAYVPAPALEESGYVSDTWVPSGVLAFGAGLIVANVFDGDVDDYYHHHYYYPDYGHGRYPPCPPHRYRPGYGYRPGHYYNRPPRYEDRLRDHHLLVVDHGSDDYWNHFDERPTDQARADSVPSPITVARMNRSEPGQYSAVGGATLGRVETMSGTAARQPGYPGHAPEVDAVGQPSYARERGPGHDDEGRDARYQGGDRTPSAREGGQGPQRYDSDRGEPRHEVNSGPRLLGGNPAPPDYRGAREPHAQGGDREPPRDEGAPRQPPRTSPGFVAAPGTHASSGVVEHGNSGPSVPVRVPAPPPAPSSDGRHGHAGSDSHDAGGERAAGPHVHDATPPATGRKAGVVTQSQQP